MLGKYQKHETASNNADGCPLPLQIPRVISSSIQAPFGSTGRGTNH